MRPNDQPPLNILDEKRIQEMHDVVGVDVLDEPEVGEQVVVHIKKSWHRGLIWTVGQG